MHPLPEGRIVPEMRRVARKRKLPSEKEQQRRIAWGRQVSAEYHRDKLNGRWGRR